MVENAEKNRKIRNSIIRIGYVKENEDNKVRKRNNTRQGKRKGNK